MARRSRPGGARTVRRGERRDGEAVAGRMGEVLPGADRLGRVRLGEAVMAGDGMDLRGTGWTGGQGLDVMGRQASSGGAGVAVLAWKVFRGVVSAAVLASRAGRGKGWRDKEGGEMNWTEMATVIPAGKAGKAEVRHWECTDHGGLHAVIRGEGTRNGVHAQLFIGGHLVMSDTDMERNSNQDAVWAASGDVLVGGLGLGMVLLPMARKLAVKTITVIESSPDVVRLVVHPLRRALTPDQNQKVTVIRDDIRTWRPTPRTRYDLIYLDIWPDICADDLDDHRALTQAWRPFLRKGGAVMCWQHDELLSRGRR